MNQHKLKLDIDKKVRLYRGDNTITIRQGDKMGCRITADLYDHDVRFTVGGLIAYFVMELPNRANYYRAEASYDAGTVDVTIDETYAASVAGRTDNCYFELRQGTTVIASTQTFSIIVEPSALDGKTPGETYDAEIEQALEEMATATEAATEAASSANDAADSAEGAASDANTATASANDAAADATLAAAQARGAISANLRFSIDVVEIGGEQRLVLIDAGEESE